MRQLLVLSGKGGTGKTTVAASFVALSGTPAFADCDVDASNLHLSVRVDAPCVESDYEGMPRASVDAARCTGCGACEESCRFDAIRVIDGSAAVNRVFCEGCGVCRLVCPGQAVTLTPEVTGRTMLYASGSRVFSTARLRAGSGNSGKLVAQVKRGLETGAQGLDAALRNDRLFAVVDGSPGIGCPVLASLAGVDVVLVVVEPTLSGQSDMERLLDVIERLRVRSLVCVNKSDIDPGRADAIEAICDSRGVPFVGRIPLDHRMAAAVRSGEVPAGDGDGRTGGDGSARAFDAIRQVYERTMAHLFPEPPAPAEGA